jgi:hypothetical protein
MVTRFYTHTATSTATGTLPSTIQSTQTITATFDAATVNRSMNTTVATGSQTDLSATKTGGGSSTVFHMTRFISDPLDMTSLSANTWTISIAGWCGSFLPFYPSQANKLIPSCVYVWRPSTGTKVGTVFDGLSSTTTNQTGNTSEFTSKVNFTGSAVSSMTQGDLLVYEAQTGTDFSTSQTWHYAYNGSTITTTDNTATSNHAAYLETPQTITFYTPPTTFDCTVTSKVVTNKIITKN